MSLIAGMTAGFGQGQGEYNKRMLDFINQKNQTMANMYSHLADSAQDQDVASEFTRRAMGWASANPMMDPKGYQQLVKGEKVGLHDIVDQAHQSKVADYHQSTFGVPTSTGVDTTNNSGGGFIPGSVTGQKQSTPMPGLGAGTQMVANAPQTPPMPQSQAAPPPADLMSQLEHVPSDFGVGGQSGEQPQPVQPPVQSLMAQPASAPIQQTQPQPTPQDMDHFIRQGLPPEPPMYGAMGHLNPEWSQWHDIYTKKMEGTVATPAAMQSFMGAPYMPAGFASPYASMMGREISAGARGLSQGFKLVNGQFVPMNPDEYSMTQNLKMAKDAAQTEMYKSITPLRQMMAQYYQAQTTKAGAQTAIIPMEMKVRLAQLGIQQKHLELSELNTNARIFGTDATGKAIPGALALDDGTGNMTPVGSMWGKNVLPTTATQGKAEMAVPVMSQTNKLEAFASDPNNAELFGKIQGNLANFIAGKFGTGDPREGALRADLISLASLMVPLHGFRSQKAAEEFLGRLSQGMSPEAFISALKAFNSVGLQLYQNGMPSLVNSAGSTSPRMGLPPGQAPVSKSTVTGGTTKAPPTTTQVNQREWDALIAKGHTPVDLKKSGIILVP